MANPASSPAPPAPSPSIWAVAAGVVALGVLFYVSGGGWLIVLLAAALVGVYFTPVRLEGDSYLRWMVRIALIALIYQVSQGQEEGGRYTSLAIGSAGLRTLFGQLYGAEMVVQAWRRRDSEGHQQTLSVTLFSALVFLTACNVFDPGLIALATPVYMIFVAFALREWKNRNVPAPVVPVSGDSASLSASRLRTLTTIQRVGAILLTIGIGFGVSQTVSTYKNNINDLGARLLQDAQFLENLGMSEQPTLGSAFGLRGGVNRVLKVRNLVGDGHLRGATFVEYQRGRWGPRLNRLPRVAADSEAMSPLRPLYGSETSRQRDDMTITRLEQMPLLFAPTNTTGLTTGDELDQRDRVEWTPEAGGVMRSNAPAPYEYIVTVASDAVAYQGPLCQPVLWGNSAVRAPFLSVPNVRMPDKTVDEDARFMRDLAVRLTKDRATVPLKIAAITQYLLTNHAYSLSTRVGAGDPVAGFLREKKAAHCEFFAASSTLLLRYAGIPARYVTGYLAHEPGTEPGETAVRQRDAHAWTEAWVDGVGWISVDATPGDGRPDEMPKEKISPFQRVKEWFQDTWQKAKNKLADIPPAVLNGIVIASALLPLGIYIVFATLKARRLKAALVGTKFAYTISDEMLAALSARYEAAFKKAGRPFAPEQTYTEQFPSVASDELTETGQRFARLYDVARFGGQRDRETLTTLTDLLTQIERDADAARKTR